VNIDKQDEPVNKMDDFLIVDDILHVVNAMKHPDISPQMNESKERIFRKIDGKIRLDSLLYSKPAHRRNLLHYTLSVASVLIIAFVSVAIHSYWKRYESDRLVKQMMQTQVELDVPLGVISRTTLPDGTKVILNGGSKLTYPALFGNNRHITFSGEGFFDVVKDVKKPFLIHTKNLSVKVLGTRFGINAYEEDSQTTLTLEEGSVSALPLVDDMADLILLKPDQQLVMDNKTKEIQKRNVKADDYTAWKDGILIFRDQTLGEIALILERRFNTKINIPSNAIRNERYVAQFKHGENIEQIIEKLSYKRSWKYVKQNGMIEFVKR
jgi:ferric-dicitrate binding protein FerR (iron transport regulator)